MEKITGDYPRERVFIGSDSLITEIKLNPYEKTKSTCCTPRHSSHKPSISIHIAATSDGKSVLAASEITETSKKKAHSLLPHKTTLV
jgi:hypothetical protein